VNSRATTAAPGTDLPPEFPPGIDPWDYLRDCYAGAWEAPARHGCSRREPCGACGACYRRAITRHNPVAFSVTYLSHLFKRYPNTEGIPVWSFCDLQLDLAHIGARWSVPGPHRDGLVGPRDSAKSLGWIELVIWALAHGHRRYVLAFSATREQIIPQMADVRRALRSRLLLADFPELRIVSAQRGGRDTMTHLVTQAGTIRVAGLRESVYGLREEDTRPEVIIFDDADLDAGKMTPAEKAKLVSKFRGILPMNLDAAVLFVGVPTMPGCIAHDIVRRAQNKPGLLPDRGRWVDELGVRPHYWPAILHEGTTMARSLWPQKWSLRRLLAMDKRDPIGFAYDYRCDPSGQAAVRLWTPETYRYATGSRLRRRALSIDGAVTRRATSDRTALVVGGQTHEGARQVIVEHAEMGRITAHELQARIWAYADLYPESLDTVLIDGTNGGELWFEVLEPWPDTVEYVIVYSLTGHKRARIEALHRRYTRGAVPHAMRLPELEDQQCAWIPPATGVRDTQPDDLLDAESGLVRWFLDGWPGDEIPDDRDERIARSRLSARARPRVVLLPPARPRG
jgi:hypothetical protein